MSKSLFGLLKLHRVVTSDHLADDLALLQPGDLVGHVVSVRASQRQLGVDALPGGLYGLELTRVDLRDVYDGHIVQCWGYVSQIRVLLDRGDWTSD